MSLPKAFSLFATCLLCCSCAQTQADLALKRIDAAVEAFGKAHPRQMYPRSLKELSAFAAAGGKPLDFSPFSKISLERPRPTFMSISYEARSSEPGHLPVIGGLAYSTVY
jgi:hypothetical protein